MRKLTAISLAALLAFAGAQAAVAGHGHGPSGFYGSWGGPGHRTMNSVDEVYRACHDDDWISLKGRLTRYFGDEDYEFTDEFGSTIEVELDDDRDWSYISKDQKIEIFGEVDRDDFRVKIKVEGARPLN